MAERKNRSTPRRLSDREMLAALAHAEQCLLWIGGRWMDVPLPVRQRALACGHAAAETLQQGGYREMDTPLIGTGRD